MPDYKIKAYVLYHRPRSGDYIHKWFYSPEEKEKAIADIKKYRDSWEYFSLVEERELMRELKEV